MNPAPREIVLVAAMGENRVIGVNGALPWHLPSDLKHFKAITLGAPILMGRKTFDSIGRKPLPKRHNIVVSRGAPPYGMPEGVSWVGSLAEAIACADAQRNKIPGRDALCVFVIGGAQIYAEALSAGLASRIELTRVALAPPGDAFFPAFESHFELARHEPQEEGGVSFAFETWIKKRTNGGFP